MALRTLFAIALLALAATAAVPSSQAVEYPEVGGCGADDVEVCFPVCVTYPCYGYVCVNTQQAAFCRTLGP